MVARRLFQVAAAGLLLGSRWDTAAAQGASPSAPASSGPLAKNADTRRPPAAPAAASRSTPKVADKLRIVIPANAGGGWDSTGRMLGASLVACGATGAVEYENKGGKGGTLGLAHFVERYDADPNALLIGGMVMLGALALHRPPVDIARVKPLAKLTSEYLALVIAADSAWRKVGDLSAALRADVRAITIAGGSAGGIDHMFAGFFVRTVGADPKQMNYLPFASGKDDVVGVLTSGKAQVAITGVGEVQALLKSGRVRVLGVSSKRPIDGLPTLREQGVSTDMANWRGVFAGQALGAARHAELERAVVAAAGHPSWFAATALGKVESTMLAGRDFVSVVENDTMTSRVLVFLLGLKA